MKTTHPAKRSPSGRPVAAAFAAGFITAGAVSWATPDGNLVVTLVPALLVGLAVFGLARRHRRRDQPGASERER